MLTCECDFDGDCDWYFESPDDYTTMPVGRRKRCCSCDDLIGVGDVCLRFTRFRDSLTDVDERIHGDHVRLSPWWMCERCGDLFFSLRALGFCDTIEDQRGKAREYAELYGRAS